MKAPDEIGRLDRFGLTQEVPDALLEACSEVSRRTNLGAVHCPPLIPGGPLILNYGASTAASSGGYSLSMNSAGLDESPSNDGHWGRSTTWDR